MDAIDSLSRHASVRGLTNGNIEALIDVLATTPCYLDQRAVGAIVKALLPKGKVSGDVVIKVVGSLGQGQGRPSPSTQVLSIVKLCGPVYEAI